MKAEFFSPNHHSMQLGGEKLRCLGEEAAKFGRKLRNLRGGGGGGEVSSSLPPPR